METITRINGNGQPYTVDLPLLVVHGKINDVALAHIEDSTGLRLEPTHWDSYTVQPTESRQIVALILTYDYKTRYFNNLSNPNQLHLRSDHHVGFDVQSICFDCVKHNRIVTNGLKQGDYLAC